jgi:hypothetical protein
MLNEFLHDILDGGLSTFTIGVGLFCLLIDSGLLKAKGPKGIEPLFIWFGGFYVALGVGVWLYIILH